MISFFWKPSISIATAVVVASLLLNNSGLLYANITASIANVRASLSNKRGLERATFNQSAPLVQATADVETATAAEEQPAPNNIVANASADPVVEEVENQSDVLFRQFQAWAAAQPHVTPSQPDQDVRVAQSAPAKFAAPNPVEQKRRQARRVVVRNAPAKMSTRNPQKLPRPLQNARAQAVQAPSARAQEPDENPPLIKWPWSTQ